MSITGYTPFVNYTELGPSQKYSYLTILTSLSQSIVTKDFLDLPVEKRQEILDKLFETSQYLWKKYYIYCEK